MPYTALRLYGMPPYTIVEDHGEWWVADEIDYILGPFKTQERAEQELYDMENDHGENDDDE